MTAVAGGLMSVAEVTALIGTGELLALAADRAVLTRLPRGNWIAGSTPYFMAEQGGCQDRERVFVQRFGDLQGHIRRYQPETLPEVLEEAPEHGLSVLILPAGSAILEAFAREAPLYPEMYLKPLVGWVAGIAIDDVGSDTAVVVDGRDGCVAVNEAVVLHLQLPAQLVANVHAINLFEPGDGPEIRFPRTGFEVSDCLVDGQPANFAHYLIEQAGAGSLPLVADYCGAMINVSVQAVEANGVRFYAPVFEGVGYRLARPVQDYPAEFLAAMPSRTGPVVFGCNCILNYLNCGLEGRRTEGLDGPITFGEVGYQLMNQTAVMVTLDGI